MISTRTRMMPCLVLLGYVTKWFLSYGLKMTILSIKRKCLDTFSILDFFCCKFLFKASLHYFWVSVRFENHIDTNFSHTVLCLIPIAFRFEWPVLIHRNILGLLFGELC